MCFKSPSRLRDSLKKKCHLELKYFVHLRRRFTVFHYYREENGFLFISFVKRTTSRKRSLMQNGTNSKKRKTLAKNQLFIARESLYFLKKMFFACCKFGTVIAIQCVRIDWIECSQIEGRRYNGPNN